MAALTTGEAYSLLSRRVKPKAPLIAASNVELYMFCVRSIVLMQAKVEGFAPQTTTTTSL